MAELKRPQFIQPIDEECCKQFETFPDNVDCLMEGLCQELNYLLAIHRCAFTKRKRIHKLALPKIRKCEARFVQKCPCRYKKNIEIVRLEKQPRTRTDQLALPAARKLLLFKEDIKKLFPPKRIEIVNRLTRKSLLSLYSRLASVYPPVEPERIHKWDKEEWKTHTKYLKQLARHKVAIVPPEQEVKKMPIKRMKRFKILAIPKLRIELEKENWVLTPEMKYFNPNQRLLKLAAAKTYEESGHRTLPIPVPSFALRYKPSPRIKELAMPHEKRAGESDLKENPFAISPNALKAKPSQRIQELAEPKEFENKHIRENPFVVSPQALKAKCSPRLAELAQPKG